MGVITATADDYSHVLHDLRPVGPAVAGTDPVLQGLAAEYARAHNRLGDLLRESDPRTVYELLTEWERAFGLPDGCVDISDNLEARINALVARVRGAGSATPQYFIDLAATVGYEITITELTPHTVGSDVDYPLYGEEIRYVWQVNSLLNTTIYADVNSTVDTPLAAWGNSILECIINRSKPAHTFVQFIYFSEYDADSDAIFSAMPVFPGIERRAVIDAAVRSLKSSGVWDALDSFYHFAATGLIDWKRPSALAVEHGGSSIVDGIGFVGDGAKYLDLQFAPAVDGINYTLNDASFGLWLHTVSTGNPELFGERTPTTTLNSIYSGSSSARYSVNNWGFVGSYASDLVAGFVLAQRTSSSSVELYNGSATVAIDTSASSGPALSSNSFWLGANNGSVLPPCDAKISVSFAGASLSSGLRSALKTIISDSMAAL